jgi:hypothetical protein
MKQGILEPSFSLFEPMKALTVPGTPKGRAPEWLWTLATSALESTRAKIYVKRQHLA